MKIAKFLILASSFAVGWLISQLFDSPILTFIVISVGVLLLIFRIWVLEHDSKALFRRLDEIEDRLP